MSETMPLVRLRDVDVAEVILGQSPPSSAYNKHGDGLPFFQGKADFGLLHPVAKNWCTAGQKFAKPGDVLMSVRAPVGDVNIATENCVIGRGIAAIRAGTRCDPWFLYFALMQSKSALESRATGTTFASINRATLIDLDIPLPPKRGEQGNIALLLREVVRKSAEEQALLDRTQQLKRAAMRTLFTRGLKGEVQKESEIGPVPESWSAEPIAALTSTVYRYPTYYNIAYRSSGVPEIRGELLKDGGDIESDLSQFRFIDEETAARFPRVRLQAGDIVMSVRGTMGKVGIARDIHVGAVITANLIRLAPNAQKIVPEFLKYTLISERFLDTLDRASPQTTIKTITASDLKSLRVPTPPTLDEQREIVAVLDAIDRKIDLHKRKRAVLDELFKSLLHKLMTREIRIADLDISVLNRTAPVAEVAA